MLYKTRGIVLNYIKYRETSIITKIYTEEFGIQSYIVNGIRSKTARIRIALFQPLTLLDLVVYHKPHAGLQRISEIKCLYPFRSIPFQFTKSAIAIFVAEVLNKTLKEEAANNPLFEYLIHLICQMDQQSEGIENVHLKFLIDFSAYLGFMPNATSDIIPSEELQSVSEEELTFLNRLITSTPEEIIKTENAVRRNILEHLLRFYARHIENFGLVNSVKVLKEVLSK